MFSLGLIGIEIAATQVVVSYLSNQGISVIQSESGSREIPTNISYLQNERLFSDQALTRIQTNFKNSIRYPFRYLGKENQLDNSQILSEYSINQNGDYQFQVNYQGNLQTLEIFQIIAGIFGYIEKQIQQKIQEIGVVVLAVPSYYSQLETMNLKKALDISSFQISQIIYSHQALIQSYLYQFQFDLSQKSQSTSNLCVIDIGYASTTVTLASIDGINAKIIAARCDQNLGVRNIDYEIYQFFIKIFTQRQKNIGFVFPRNNKQLELRLMSEIQGKMRKVLSANSSTEINVEDFYNGSDFCFTMTRDILEKECCLEFQHQFKSLLDDLNMIIIQAGVQITQFEICGGGSRIPFIQNMIKSNLKLDQIGTIFSEQSISRGAAIEAAKIGKELYGSVQIEQFFVLPCLMSSTKIFAKLLDSKSQIYSQKFIPAFSPMMNDIQIVFDIPSKDLELVAKNLFELNQNHKDKIQHDFALIQFCDENRKGQPFYTIVLRLPIGFDYQSLVHGNYKLIVQVKMMNNFFVQLNTGKLINLATQMETQLSPIMEFADFAYPEEIEFYRTIEKRHRQNDEDLTILKEKMNEFETTVLEIKNRYHQVYQSSANLEEKDLIPLQQALEVGEGIRENLSSNNFQAIPLKVLLQAETEILQQNELLTTKLNNLTNDLIVLNHLDNIALIEKRKEFIDQRPFSGLKINLRGLNIGDGSGMLGLFQSGASKISKFISDINLKDSLEIDIGNCSLTDIGIEYITNVLRNKVVLNQLKIDIQNSDLHYKNTLSLKSVEAFILCFASLRQLRVLTFNIDSVDDFLFNQFFETIQLKLMRIKSLTFEIKRGEVSDKLLNAFIEYCEKNQQLTKCNFSYYNSQGVRTSQFQK